MHGKKDNRLTKEEAKKLKRQKRQGRKKIYKEAAIAAKARETVIKNEDNKPKRIDTILISTQHTDDTDMKTLKNDIHEKVINAVVDKNMIDNNTKIYINPTGRFVIGGPLGDTGLTGRKIIVDTYGGYARLKTLQYVLSGMTKMISLELVHLRFL